MFTISGPGWSIENLEAVIFDKDGTIVDVHPYWAEIIRRRANAVIAHYHLAESVFPQLCTAMGLSLTENRLLPEGPVGLASREEVIEALHRCLTGLGVNPTTEILTALFAKVHEAFLPDIDGYLRLIPGTEQFFTALRQAGARMAVVTSDTAVNTRHAMNKLGINACFDVIVGRDTTPEPKISGVPARWALEALGRSPDRTVCIGDAPMDFRMAASSGCRAGVGVATGQTPADQLRKHTPYVAASMADLQAEAQA